MSRGRGLESATRLLLRDPLVAIVRLCGADALVRGGPPGPPSAMGLIPFNPAFPEARLSRDRKEADFRLPNASHRPISTQ
jgi:hypothetical protein